MRQGNGEVSQCPMVYVDISLLLLPGIFMQFLVAYILVWCTLSGYSDLEAVYIASNRVPLPHFKQ